MSTIAPLILSILLGQPFQPDALEISSSAYVHATDVTQPKPTAMHCLRRASAWICDEGWIEGHWVDRVIREASKAASPGGSMRFAGFGERQIESISRSLRDRIAVDRSLSTRERRAAATLASPVNVRNAIRSWLLRPLLPSAMPAVSSADVTIRMRDRRHTLTIESHATYDRMLPWAITYDGTTRISINAGLSLAIAALLPTDDVNADRLTDAAPDLTDYLLSSIDTRMTGCRYDEDPRDRSFCAPLRDRRALVPMVLPTPP